jgi:hypothetical protein
MNIRYPIYEGVYRILTIVREAGRAGGFTKQNLQAYGGKGVQGSP